jgi:hypothetical protein
MKRRLYLQKWQGCIQTITQTHGRIQHHEFQI